MSTAKPKNSISLAPANSLRPVPHGCVGTQLSRMGNRRLWFTSLISRATTLPAIHASLDAEGALDVRTVEMLHGQKKSRLVAWTFQTPEQHEAWAKRRWS